MKTEIENVIFNWSDKIGKNRSNWPYVLIQIGPIELLRIFSFKTCLIFSFQAYF